MVDCKVGETELELIVENGDNDGLCIIYINIYIC